MYHREEPLQTLGLPLGNAAVVDPPGLEPAFGPSAL